MRCAVKLGLVLSLHQKFVEDGEGVDVVLFGLSANIDIRHDSCSVVLQDAVKPDQGVRSQLGVKSSALVHNSEKDFQDSLNILLVVKILPNLPWVSADKVIKGSGRSSVKGVSFESSDVFSGVVL